MLANEKSMKKIAIIVIALNMALGAFADEDMRLAIRRVEFVANSTNLVVVRLAYVPPRDGVYVYGESRLDAIELVWNGQKMSVPERDLKVITNPQVATLEILEGAYWGSVNSNRWYRYIQLLFGDPTTKQGERMEAQFLFCGGEYKELTIHVPVDPRPIEGTIRSQIGFTVNRGVNDDAFTGGGKKYGTLQDFLLTNDIGKANQAMQAAGAAVPQPDR